MQPFAKTSKSKKGMRRAHHALKATNVVHCPRCGSSKLPHRMCGNCGFVSPKVRVAVDETAAS